jgi:hypothetical protein
VTPVETVAFIAAFVVSFFVGKLVYRLMFADADDFWECVRFSFTPDLFSLFKGEYFQDVTKSFKFGLFLAVTAGSGVLTYHGLTGIVDSRYSGPPSLMQDHGTALPAEKVE